MARNLVPIAVQVGGDRGTSMSHNVDELVLEAKVLRLILPTHMLAYSLQFQEHDLQMPCVHAGTWLKDPTPTDEVVTTLLM